MPNLTAKLCAITFQGNASHGLQQDAFFFIDDWYHEKLGLTPVVKCQDDFCVAVADGVSESSLSEYASKATMKAVKQLWQDYQANPSKTSVMSIEAIYDKVANTPKYKGAMTTLAMVYRLKHQDNEINPLIIKHIGDSRVYHLSNQTHQWQCLTRDHNVLNQLIDEKAETEGRIAKFSEYNREGMAGSLYALTDILMIDNDLDNNPMPAYGSQTLTVQSGDSLVICTDGVHDLVPCDQWQLIDETMDLQQWLKALRKQIYASEGRAYDNATAIVIRF